MKSLVKYLNENKNWRSNGGAFRSIHLEQLKELTHWSTSKLVKLLNTFEDSICQQPVEYAVDGKELYFVCPDLKQAWKCDGENWEEIDFEKGQKYV